MLYNDDIISIDPVVRPHVYSVNFVMNCSHAFVTN